MSVTKITAFFLDGPWESTWHTVNFSGAIDKYRLAWAKPGADLIKPGGDIDWQYCDYYFFRYPWDISSNVALGFKHIWIAVSDPDAESWLWQDEDARDTIVKTMTNMAEPNLVTYIGTNDQFPKGLADLMGKAASKILEDIAGAVKLLTSEMQKIGEATVISTEALEHFEFVAEMPNLNTWKHAAIMPAIVNPQDHIKLTGI